MRGLPIEFWDMFITSHRGSWLRVHFAVPLNSLLLPFEDFVASYDDLHDYFSETTCAVLFRSPDHMRSSSAWRGLWLIACMNVIFI